MPLDPPLAIAATPLVRQTNARPYPPPKKKFLGPYVYMNFPTQTLAFWKCFCDVWEDISIIQYSNFYLNEPKYSGSYLIDLLL